MMQEQTRDLRDHLWVLRARKGQIALVTLVVFGVVTFFTLQQTPIYEGQAKVLINPTQNLNSSGSQPPDLDTEQQIADSPAVAVIVQRSLALRTPVAVLRGGLHVSSVPNADVLSIAYDSPSPTMAARIANGFATAYIEFRAQQAVHDSRQASMAVLTQISAVQGRLASLDRRINQTGDPVTKSTLQSNRDTLVAQLGVLEQQLSTLQAQTSASQAGTAQVLAPATVPGSPASPVKTRNLVLGLIVGLILGILFAFLRDRLDERIRGPEELAGEFGAPVLAAVPRLPGWRKNAEPRLALRSDPRSYVAEAYRTLATNFQYSTAQSGAHVVMITSALAGEGKTTTASNLALAIAQVGKRVLLISGDLRRPRVHRFFNVSNEIGLSDILAGSKTLPEIAIDSGVPNLLVLASGATAADPAALLGGERTAEFFGAVVTLSAADLVIVDSPPVLGVADASILARHVDGVVLVLDGRRARRAATSHARDQLRNAGATMIGAVYNNFDPTLTSVYYDTYYAYSGHGQAASQNGSARRPGKRPLGWGRRNGVDGDAVDIADRSGKA